MAANITIIVIPKSAVDSMETRTLFLGGQPAQENKRRFHFHTTQTDTRLDEIEQKVSAHIQSLGRSHVVLTWVLNWVAKGTEARRNLIQDIYGNAAKAVILLAGHRARKSKTINRLVGQELLSVIQRVKSRVDASLSTYKLKHFPDIYPNVILLVAAWDSSALGKTIYTLYCSNLVDDERANIVVVTTNEKNAQWRIEEGRRRGIIPTSNGNFPQIVPWEIVFIENGGGKDMSAKFHHQNLYDAIQNIIKCPSADGSLDLVGIQALQVLTGAAPLAPSAEHPEVFVDRSMVALGTFGRTMSWKNRKLLMPNPFTSPRRHYSSDWAFRAAIVGHQKLSEDMLNLIRRLPPWSPEEQPKYTQFFMNYGTHVLTQLVLGGTVRAIVDSTRTDKCAELTVLLERCFPPSISLPALKKEPVFCPDHELTKYTPIYELNGLTPTQQTFLEKGYRAYQSYIASRPDSVRKNSRAEHDLLQREFNLKEAVKLLRDAVMYAFYRFRQGR
ncbi:hypothetical protein C8J57DRAFT_1395678 [Mycena rebaudengoi]|nr:hypothetical protein C8J57DRAFT_1395678 [Mycena rebaudengoi]